MGKVTNRTARSPALDRKIESGTGATANKPVVRPGGESHSGSSAIRSSRIWTMRLHGLPESARNRAFERVVLTIVSSWQKSVER